MCTNYLISISDNKPTLVTVNSLWKWLFHCEWQWVSRENVQLFDPKNRFTINGKMRAIIRRCHIIAYRANYNLCLAYIFFLLENWQVQVRQNMNHPMNAEHMHWSLLCHMLKITNMIKFFTPAYFYKPLTNTMYSTARKQHPIMSNVSQTNDNLHERTPKFPKMLGTR